MKKKLFEIKLVIRHPKELENAKFDISERQADIISAMETFNERFEYKKIQKLLEITDKSILIMFQIDADKDSKNLGKELTVFSRTLYNKFNWGDLTEVPNRLFLVDEYKEIFTEDINESSNKPQYQMLDINLLELDRDNPRIKASMEMYNDVDDAKIRLALMSNSSKQNDSGTTSSNLKESIRTNGGVIHPIIVNHDTSSGKYVVIEGNTRVQIYRDLKKDNIPGQWERIPAIVHTDLLKSIIDSIRLQAHLVGPREWDAYSKAKYLDFLYRENNLTLAQIVDFCGGNKKDVNEYIQAYRLMEQHYRPILDSDQDFDKSRFSAFREVQNKPIQYALDKFNYTIDDFAQWVMDEKFSQLQLIRQLPRVLENEQSRKIFLKPGKGIKDALEVLSSLSYSTIDMSKISIEELSNEILKKIRAMPYSEYMSLKKGGAVERKNLLFELMGELQSFCKELEDSNSNDE